MTSQQLAHELDELKEGTHFLFGPVLIEKYQGKWQVQAGAGVTICKSARRAGQVAVWLNNKCKSRQI
jgi:hypothetical protein